EGGANNATRVGPAAGQRTMYADAGTSQTARVAAPTPAAIVNRSRQVAPTVVFMPGGWRRPARTKACAGRRGNGPSRCGAATSRAVVRLAPTDARPAPERTQGET